MSRLAAPTPDLSTLAWNGIRISFSNSWEVTSIRDRYALLEDADGPALDLRWEKVVEKGSSPIGLAHLQKRSGKTDLDIHIPDPLPETWPPPEAWNGASDMEAAPFLWSTKSGPEHRIGCLLRSPAADMTIVARFHREPTPQELTAAARTTSSLTAFTPSQLLPWQIYDIGFAVPGSFILESFSLQPGHYRFIFKDTTTRIVVDRVGPASVVLGNMPRRDWVKKFFSLEKAKTHEIREAEGDEGPIEWAACLKGDLVPSRGLPFLKPSRVCRGRVWLPADKNMLLSVSISDRVPPSDTLFSEVCSSYVLV